MQNIISNNIFEIKNLVIKYGARKILDGISFNIPKGQITVILGGSGSGKTTILRSLIGLLKPDDGQIIFGGYDLSEILEKNEMIIRRRMGVLFQGGALLNSMTISENISLPLIENTELDPHVIDIIVKMKLEQVGLAGFGGFLPDQLSGGMKKRAALARALVMDPEILFVDEPSAGLDPVTAAGLDRLLINLKQTFKMTIVVVTHELPSLRLIADNVCMIDKGRVLFTGSLAEIEQSSDKRIRQFLDREPDSIEFDSKAWFKQLTTEP